MDSDAAAVRLQAIHDEVFELYLVAERVLLIASRLDGDVTLLRVKRDELRHLAAGYAQLAADARRKSQ